MPDRHTEKSFSLRLGPDRAPAEAAAKAAGLSLYAWVKLAVRKELESSMKPEPEHWHYATTLLSTANPAFVETMVSTETGLTKEEAKRMLQPMVRAAQGRARYEHPVTGAITEPADWWMENEELVWIGPFPEVPPAFFTVYSCPGDCDAAAVRHRDDMAAHLSALAWTWRPSRRASSTSGRGRDELAGDRDTAMTRLTEAMTPGDTEYQANLAPRSGLHVSARPDRNP